MTDRPQSSFFDQLLAQVPEFRPAYEEHLLANGELLPHLLMGDLVLAVEGRLVGSPVRGIPALSEQGLRHALALLENAVDSQGAALSELVGVSFTENLDFNAPYFERLWPMLGPALRRDVYRHRPDLKARLA